ncbi:MAG TPA: flagellar export protein FliJ [Candidatus Aquilonibacter sp.]|nr:flagellar export protein FliJ [Candidatus Aquilonibacter sp.]
MKKFVFALQPVLEQRKRVEEEKQQIVAQRKRAADEAEAELRRLNDEFREASDRLRNSHGDLDAEDLRLHYAHLQFLDRTIVSQIQVVAERRVALDRARNDLLAASKERKVVEKLKTRRKEAHQAEEARIEQNELDDGNARRYARAGVRR